MKEFIKSFIQNENDVNLNLKSVDFFNRSPESRKIWLTILDRYYDQNPISFEELISEVCPKYASRQTVRNIVKIAIEKNYLIKTQDKEDKRKFLFTPTDFLLKESDTWIHSLRRLVGLISLAFALTLSEVMLSEV